MTSRFKVSLANFEHIFSMEMDMYTRYMQKVTELEKLFATYQCTLKVIKYWTVDDKTGAIFSKPPVGANHTFWISYVVTHQNKPIIYDDEQSPLTRSYMVVSISQVSRSYARQSEYDIRLYDDMRDVETELMEDLCQVKSIMGK